MWLWFKRLAPLFLILALWLAYTGYQRWQIDRRRDQDREHALVTAEVWVATARFRNDPDAYLVYRDSILEANGLSTAEMFEYLRRYRKHPEQYHSFTTAVNYYVDSLYQVEDSLRKEAANLTADSAPGP